MHLSNIFLSQYPDDVREELERAGTGFGDGVEVDLEKFQSVLASSHADRRRPAGVRAGVLSWPKLQRRLAAFRNPGDYGLGDTCRRLFARFGADRAARLYSRVTGRPCGCVDVAVWLNAAYPYPAEPGKDLEVGSGSH